MIAAQRSVIDDRGQSLVEIALAMPLLLVTLLGMVDVGRAFIYSTAITNAAREAAYFAAKESTAVENVAKRACNEAGFDTYNAAPSTPSPQTNPPKATCASGIVVVCSPCPSGTSDVTVTVTYTYSLVSGYLFQSLLGRDSLTATGVASFRSLQ